MGFQQKTISEAQLTWLVLLRLAIGWHFLYEGLLKVSNQNWSSGGYLLDSKGFFAPIFHAMTTNQGVLSIVDFLNQWGLILIGLGLIFGVFTRWACYAGMLLLAFYYLSHPPLIGISNTLPTEGNYFLVDKVVIEFLALRVLSLFPSGKLIGLDHFF